MTFFSLLPPNATQGELAQEQVMAHVGDMPIDIRIVKNPDLCPVELLPWLAWEFGVTHWLDAWSEEQKRSTIKSATQVNKGRGTSGAVRQALSATGFSIDVIEWFNETPPAEAYSFRIIVNNAVSDGDLVDITRQINDAKNARSWLAAININPPEIHGGYYMGGAITGTITTYIEMI